ncbi:MAG: phytanoyl-CoA dioxygenase family protein, partial [Natronospirillum sp.]
MTTTVATSAERPRTAYATEQEADIKVFAHQCQQTVHLQDYPLALAVEQRVLIYDGKAVVHALEKDPMAVYSELNRALSHGPGVVVIRDTFPDLKVVDRHSAVLDRIMAQEADTQTAGDHFALAGANTRLWNALQKAALSDPVSFIEYYRNPIIHAVSHAWLGPGYNLTAQINVVHPGGKAQQPHRDYHLGFQTNAVAAQYPLAVHRLSPLLT